MTTDNAGRAEDSCSNDGVTKIHSIEEAASSVATLQCVSFGGKRGKKAPKLWRGRLKSRSAAYGQFIECCTSWPTAFAPYFKHGILGYQSHQRHQSHKRILGRPYEDIAHVDIQGRLVNADTATSLDRVGGRLGLQETLAWQGLCPLQRVLVVAVAAAAASAAKDTNADEVLRLQRVIHKRESVLLQMREELNALLIQVDIQRSQLNNNRTEKSNNSHSLEDLVDLLSEIDLDENCDLKLEEENSNFRACVDEVIECTPSTGNMRVPEFIISPVVSRQLNFLDLPKRVSPIEESPIGEGPGQDLIEKMLSSSWIDELDMGCLLEDQSQEQESDFTRLFLNKEDVLEQDCSGLSKNCSGLSTFEKRLEMESIEQLNDEHIPTHSGLWEMEGNLTAVAAAPDYSNAIEWLSETSSVIMDPFSPMPSEKQVGNRLQANEGPVGSCTKSMADEKSFTSRARCGNTILDIQKRVLTLLDEATSNLLDSLSFINDKAGQLKSPDTDSLTPRKPEEAWNKEIPASVIIKQKATKASLKVISLQKAMVQLWDDLGPEAMAALDISPSDFDDYLTNLEIAKILNDDACELSTGSESIESWQEWFRRGFDNPETSFLHKLQAPGDKVSERSNVEPLSDWPPSGSIYVGKCFKKPEISPVSVAVRQKIEKLLLPLFENARESDSAQQSTDLAKISEVLVSEFEKSAAKVSSLKKYVKVCDVKRKQVERKLLEAWEQDSKNQAKSCNEIKEVKRQLRLKEAAYEQLITTRKALVASKTKEITELREDCRRQNITLQDMAAAAKATQESSEKRLAMLEEICRKKDSAILSLKQEIFELEGKVQELQVCQSPAELRPMNLPPAERSNATESADDLFDNENYRTFGDDCQIRGSFQSMCGSENRRTSWGSDLSAQEFHIIDTPWSSELTAGQDFIEEAAFKGRSLSIFQNVNSSQDFLFDNTLRKLDTTPGGGLDVNDGPSSSCSSGEVDLRPIVNLHRDSKGENANIPDFRKELSKSVMNINMVTSRSKKRGDRLRASTGVLSAVGPNTPFKPRRQTPASKVSQSAFNVSLKGANNPKENSSRSRHKWV